MKSIYIYCDGGFGNRYNAMLSGLSIADASGLNPIIVWPINNWCGASYEDIFEHPRNAQNRELTTFVDEKDAYNHLMVKDHLGMNVPNISPLDFTSFDSLLAHIKTTDKNVFYYVATIPECIDINLIKKHMLANPFRTEIKERANTFIEKNNLSEFFGVQIRKTDFGASGADEQNLFDIISQCQDKVFFVCSDDKDVEHRFSSLENVRIYEKKAHVEKLVDGDWTTHTSDYSGRIYACNVNRGALSVIEAIVDLLILSKSKIVNTSSSTFLRAALMLQAYGAD